MVSRTRMFLIGGAVTMICWAIVLIIYVGRLETVSQSHRVRDQSRQPPASSDRTKQPAVDHKAAWDSIPGKGDVAAMQRKRFDDTYKKSLQKGGKGGDVPDVDPVARVPPLMTTTTTESAVAAHFEPQQMQQPARVLDLDSLAMIKSDADQQKKDAGYKHFAFNMFLSDRIGDRRDVPDSRNELCKAQVYPSVLPKASIIICYFNEAPSALIRMVNSILDRTPRNLLQEILLINDMSDSGDAEKVVGEYASTNWPADLVKMSKTERREGLIRAKVVGSRKATGEVLVFLDSHCEVNQMWLEPLLARIKENPHNVVCPIIDIIDSDTFKYVESPVCRGGFTWGMFFKWDYPPWSYFKTPEDYIKPLRSATMAGGLFAISKEYFEYLGEYDRGMDVWGAENVELSFRIWMCGGQLDIIPCSRVGHIFRKRRPYGANSDSMGKNSIRAARVWLDEYLDNFFQNRPHLRADTKYGDISEQVALRKRLNCKSFHWFLENVYPELLPGATQTLGVERQAMAMVEEKSEVVSKYRIRLAESRMCLAPESSSSRISKGSRVMIERCDDSARSQVWHETGLKELRPMGSGRLCMDGYKGLRLMKCDLQQSFQEWKRTGENGTTQLYNPASGQCVFAMGNLPAPAEMRRCSDGDKSHWSFDSISESSHHR